MGKKPCPFKNNQAPIKNLKIKVKFEKIGSQKNPKIGPTNREAQKVNPAKPMEIKNWGLKPTPWEVNSPLKRIN